LRQQQCRAAVPEVMETAIRQSHSFQKVLKVMAFETDNRLGLV
jgi:hypothetical protein